MPSKQADGRYRTKVVVAPGEKPVWISARTRRELEEKKRLVRETYIGGAKPRAVTFHALVIEWFTAIKKPRIKRHGTLVNYENAINLHLLPFFPEQQLITAVRRADLQRCLDACAGMSSTPAVLVHSVMRKVFAYALSEGILTSDPTLALTLPDTKPSAQKDAFTPEQEDRLLSVAATQPFGLMLYLLYYLGIRRGEMLGLKWGDFDWDTQMVRIERSVDFSLKKKKEPLGYSLVKTEAGTRLVPVPDQLATILRPLRGLPNMPVISVDGATPLTSSQFRGRWNKLMLAAGFATVSSNYYQKAVRWHQAGQRIKNPNIAYDYDVAITPHWFRHNYITACVLAGIPAEVTMRIVGHSSYQVTIDIYTHIQNEQRKKAAVSLAGVLRGGSCQKVAETVFSSSSDG